MRKRLKRLKLTKKEALNVPIEAGVYIYWNSKGKPIYVGKSTNLKDRINSYFSTNLSNKTSKMLSETKYFSIIRVASELEALLLEAKLVRKFKTKFNTQLKDDKHPLYIKITKEKYPRILVARKIESKEKNLAYFGPFPSSLSVRRVLSMLRRIFPYSQHKVAKRGCLYSQIGLCKPCPSEIEQSNDRILKSKLVRNYRMNVNYVKNILSGKINLVKNKLQKEMDVLAKNERFEEATHIREQLKNLDYITQPITPVNKYLKDPNLIDDIREKESQELKTLISEYLPIKKLERIECYDVSHLAGTNPAASMVTFINGEPDKSLYRHFKIRQKKGHDDLFSLKEVIQRRLKHADDWGLPDLFIVDGGKAQTSIFLVNLRQYYNIPIVGLAKRSETLIIPYRFRNKIGFKQIKLSRGPSLNLLQRIRNEAHRFARRLHHKLVSKELLSKV